MVAGALVAAMAGVGRMADRAARRTAPLEHSVAGWLAAGAFLATSVVGVVAFVAGRWLLNQFRP